MRSQACEPCAKRKVRCDRAEPCSNCKRRKRDHCIYPEVSPLDRIKKLEALVRSLGGDPDGDSQPVTKDNGSHAASSPAEPRDPSRETSRVPTSDVVAPRSTDAVILEEDGHQYYLESRAWQGWLGNVQNDDSVNDSPARNPFTASNHPNAFQGMLCSNGPVSITRSYPSQRHGTVLWDTFYDRVDPLVRISFRWTLKQLQSVSADTHARNQMTDSEYSLVRAIYLVSVVSLSDELCQREFSQSRSNLILTYQTSCEEALFQTNMLCIRNISVLKALILYLMAGADRLSTHSLWSLMGLMVRNAEKIGMHRDGKALGLSAAETEERRRVWWQLQHLDLGLAVRCGMTPLTMMAEWDTKLPLNIEDDDVGPDMKESPSERRGLTSMSYCLYTYWVIEQQRHFCYPGKNQFHLSWQLDQSIAYDEKRSLVDQLEEGLNKNFLQFCDPIKPVEVLLQLSARFLVCGFRLWTSHPLKFSKSGDHMDRRDREEILSASMQTLKYNVALHTQPSIRQFQWWTKGMFPWHSLMCVLVEVSQQHEAVKIHLIWDLLSDLYAANSTLTDLLEDRRRLRAARLVVSAWKVCQTKLSPNSRPAKPEFVTLLESQLQSHSAPHGSHPYARMQPLQQTGNAPRAEPVTPESLPTPRDLEPTFDLDFQDIDWSFWSSVD